MGSFNLLSDLLSRVTDIGKRLDAFTDKKEKPLIQQCKDLLSREGEATSLAYAQQILKRYEMLQPLEQKEFFEAVVDQFGVDVSSLKNAVDDWLRRQDEITSRRLHFVSEPKSQSLLRRLNQAPNATLALVQMRQDLLSFSKEHPNLRELDQDFEHLFASWFNRGFLRLERIDWSTPAAVLEKIITYEAVHEITGWEDLRQRVAATDRRLYAYFHPALGTEPLIFVEVALMGETPSAINPILQRDRTELAPKDATTAVFYSISNCQKGLKGISFGNFLIKQVVETLRREFENLGTYITLSPVLGFREWALLQSENSETMLNNSELKVIEDLAEMEEEGSGWAGICETSDLKNMVAKYLGAARSPRGGAVDPVARFHLGNGAQLENIHLLADTSEKGMHNSWGTMVNYQYRIDDIEKNHEAYFNQDTVVMSSAVSRFLGKRT